MEIRVGNTLPEKNTAKANDSFGLQLKFMVLHLWRVERLALSSSICFLEVGFCPYINMDF